MDAATIMNGNSRSLFTSFSPFWHLWTPENHEIIFLDDTTFRAGMNLIAISALCCRDISIVTFELMSNHIHVTLSGSEIAARNFFQLFRNFLSRYLRRQGREIDFKSFECNLRELSTLDDLRNVIAYNNRNGFLVNKMETPFSYPWGAGGYYFNRHAVSRFRESTKTMTYKERCKFVHCRQTEIMTEDMIIVDNCICPLSFCDVGLWEGLFLDAHQYLFKISRNVEAQKSIAEELGETIIYTDDELFSTVCRIGKEQYGISAPSLLPSAAKISIARIMKTGYNATKKQIQRMLKLETDVVDKLFPQ